MNWPLIIGIAVHLLFSYSIFDIYFTSPLVHGIAHVSPIQDPPAKRLVLFVGTFFRWFASLILTAYSGWTESRQVVRESNAAGPVSKENCRDKGALGIIAYSGTDRKSTWSRCYYSRLLWGRQCRDKRFAWSLRVYLNLMSKGGNLIRSTLIVCSIRAERLSRLDRQISCPCSAMEPYRQPK